MLKEVLRLTNQLSEIFEALGLYVPLIACPDCSKNFFYVEIYCRMSFIAF